MALRSLGFEAISLSGYQAGIRTDTTHRVGDIGIGGECAKDAATLGDGPQSWRLAGSQGSPVDHAKSPSLSGARGNIAAVERRKTPHGFDGHRRIPVDLTNADRVERRGRGKGYFGHERSDRI